MNTLKYLVSVLFIVASVQAASNRTIKCRVLALEGGGDRGAYQAGALQYMLEKLGGAELQYDVYSGVSAGSLNSAALSLFEKGDEQNQIDYLTGVWNNITSKEVFEDWGLLKGPAYSLFKEVSLFNTAPLRKFLNGVLSARTNKRRVSFGTCDANTGEFVRQRADEYATQDQFVDAVLASSAIPIFFPPIKINGSTYIDGGTVLNIDISGGIDRCVEQGFTRDEILVDAILCQGDKIEPTGGNYDYAYQAIGRDLQIQKYNKALHAIFNAREDFPEVYFRYVVIPTVQLASGNVPLQFNHTEILSMMNQGKVDATAVIAAGPLSPQ